MQEQHIINLNMKIYFFLWAFLAIIGLNTMLYEEDA